MALKGETTAYGFEAAVSFSGKKFYGVKLDGDGKAALSGAGERVVGIMQDEPAAGEHGAVVLSGPSWAKAGASINAGDLLKSDADGKLIPVTTDKDAYVGQAMEDAATNDQVSIIVKPGFYAV